MLIASARLAQRVARTQRQHTAALGQVVLLPLDHALVAPTQQQEDRWHQSQRGRLAAGGTRMETPGGRCLYLWAAAATTLASHPAVDKEDREALMAYGKGIGRVEEMQEGVSNCGLTRKDDNEHFKLVVLVAAELQPGAGALLRVLRASVGQIQHGPPRSAEEERQVARRLMRLAPG